MASGPSHPDGGSARRVSRRVPWVEKLEAAFPAIREEYLRQERASRGLVSTYRGDDFYGHVVTTDGLLPAEQAEAEGSDPSWLNVPFLEPAPNGQTQALFPETWRAIDAIPRLNRTSIATFSSLEPNSVIPSHCGPINGNLRVHLCIDDSPGAYIRVGEEVIDWEEGKVVIFDDAFEHHVVHRGPKRRTVLLFDVWHPDWTDRELSILNDQPPGVRGAA